MAIIPAPASELAEILTAIPASPQASSSETSSWVRGSSPPPPYLVGRLDAAPSPTSWALRMTAQGVSSRSS